MPNIKLQPVEISALMTQIKSMCAGKISPAVILNCVLGANAIYIQTDPALIMDVLNRFIDNAAKFTEKGSITYGYDVSDDELYFYVKDTSIGVPRSEQDGLFEDDGTKAGTSLIIAKDIIEALGGEIGVESRGAGKGSVFWFTIPNIPAETPADTASDGPSGTKSITDDPVQAQSAPHPTRVATILVAEDNESNYLLFKSILASKYNVLHAYDGQEAVDLYKQNTVDLILMDINMPVKDGYEATREIRAISETVPIVAVTAYAFTADKQRIFESGFNAYVSKPISINRLEQVIKDLLPH